MGKVMKEKILSSTIIGALCSHLFACDKLAMQVLFQYRAACSVLRVLI